MHSVNPLVNISCTIQKYKNVNTYVLYTLFKTFKPNIGRPITKYATVVTKLSVIKKHLKTFLPTNHLVNKIMR